MRRSIALFLLLLLVPGLPVAPAAADIIMPGAKYIDSCVEIENTGEYPGYFFILYPLWMSGGSAVMKTGDCVSFYKFATPSFYAVREDRYNATAAESEGPDQAAYFAGDPFVIPSGFSVTRVSAVPASSPVESLRTIYSITSLNSTHVEIVPTSVRYTYTSGKTEEVPLAPGEEPDIPSGIGTVALVIVAISGAIILLIVWLQRRNR